MRAGYTRDLKTVYNVSGLTGELAEAQKVQISLGGTSIASRDTLNFANAAINTVLFSGFDDGTKVTITGYLPQASYVTGGILKLTGDFAGTSSIPRVVGVRGFAISSDPAGTNLVLATDNVDGSTLTWMQAGTAAGTYCYGADSRLSNARIPSGIATGDLSGFYAGPTVTGLKGSPLPVSFAAGTFLQWNIAGNGWAAIPYGSSANTVASGNDPRFTDSRVPTSHASTHKDLGSDEIASAVRGSGLIPKANYSGYIYSGWGGFSGSLATLNANTRVVEPVTVLYDGVSTNIPISSIAEGGLLLRNGSVIVTTPAIGTYVLEGDSRLSDARTPTGPAGGDLSGTYASPTVSGLRGKPIPQPIPSGFLQWSTGDTSWNYIIYGTGANTICQGNDPRIGGSGPPAAHASSHYSTGSDPLYTVNVSYMSREYWYREDFENPTGKWLATFTANSSNASVGPRSSAQDSGVFSPYNIGVVRLHKGTGASKAAQYNLANTGAYLLASGFKLETIFKLHLTGTNCTGWIGFHDGTVGVDAVDGAYFEYDSTTSANWRYATASNSSRTKVTSSVLVQTGVWQTGLIDFYIGTGINFYINGTLLGGLSGTLPTGIGRDTTIKYAVKNSATGATGIFAMDVDVVEVRALLRR